MIRSKKSKKGLCCCSLELEKIPEETTDNKDNKKLKDVDNSCVSIFLYNMLQQIIYKLSINTEACKGASIFYF